MGNGATIYLDHAATAPLDARVAAEMAACLADPSLQANPSSAHAAGRRSAARIARARAEIAALVHAPAESIVLTSGATESVNLAILGAARAAGTRDATSSLRASSTGRASTPAASSSARDST